MNQDEILNMPAGIEMDALVATKIMGIDVKHDWHWKHTTKNYSDDMNAAWEVLAKLNLTDFCIEKVGEHYCVNLTIESACGETAPLAICRAALLAVVPANIGGV